MGGLKTRWSLFGGTWPTCGGRWGRDSGCTGAWVSVDGSTFTGMGEGSNLADVSTSIYVNAFSASTLQFKVPASLGPGYCMFRVQSNAVPSTFTILNMYTPPLTPAAGAADRISQPAGPGAAAATARVHVSVGWNFKHIVNLQRIRGYNSVNMREGYPPLEIRSPKEEIRKPDFRRKPRR